MTDDKKNQDNLSEEEQSRIGQMGGQKGGKAQSGSTEDSTTNGTNPLNDNDMTDEDL